MIRPRLIPCLFLKHGVIVRSQLFKLHQVIGNPINTIQRFSHWSVDELIIIDIGKEDRHDMRREDHHIRYSDTTTIDLLKVISKSCYMPLSVGGRIRTIEDIRLRLSAGADKCIINTQAHLEPEFISEASRRFGAQAIIVGIDVRRTQSGYEVFSDSGLVATGKSPADWAQEVQRLGAGEIFLNSIDRDGSGLGFDIELVQSVTKATSIPVIACGGAGKYSDFIEPITQGDASAVAGGNIFHFFELSYPQAKKVCIEQGVPMRPVQLDARWIQRETSYDKEVEDAFLEKRVQRARSLPAYIPGKAAKVVWCTRCVYPSVSAAPMEFDEHGVCTGCRMADVKTRITTEEWERRRGLLEEIFDKYRSKDGSRYDCVIPVSGGKDSYFQAHVVKHEFGLNPLLVTYNGNNWTPEGWRNCHRMKDVLGCDHIFYSPSVDLLKKLNRLAFVIMGDMNWHAHVGITTLPVRIAAQFGIPLVIWGEHGYLDLCGQFSMNDFPEMSYRDRFEHFARGFEWNYMVGREGIRTEEMLPYRYPSDQQLYALDMRGIYLGNYLYWEANEHSKLVIEKYGFEVSDKPFDRTYRRMSNLDDMHENGVHDYLKYIKFGYGRCTDHVCKDIRAGLMSREEGIDLVRRLDHVKPSDLVRWLEYTGMTEAEFDAIADTFRDPRVWRRENGQWIKDNIWD